MKTVEATLITRQGSVSDRQIDGQENELTEIKTPIGTGDNYSFLVYDKYAMTFNYNHKCFTHDFRFLVPGRTAV